MKIVFAITVLTTICLHATHLLAQPKQPDTVKSGDHLYLDVHHLGAGKVTADAVAKAHAKDLAVQNKYGVYFINYWVDVADGDVYCLSFAPNPQAIRKTHGEAHGLLPEETYAVTEGIASPSNGEMHYFLDVHEFTTTVSPQDVAAAHQKDLATESKYGVNFIKYWVTGNKVFCLAQAPDSAAVVSTHREAHGLIPARVMEVTPGNK